MYDSRTDRADYSGPDWDTDTPWQYRTATGWKNTRKLHRFAKRFAAKADRRSEYPRTQMRGYGYGYMNMRYRFSD